MLTDLVQALTVTAEVTGYPLSEAALDVMVQDLIDYPEPQVVQALRLCRRECKGRLTLRDILERMDDGRPGPEAAWAQVLWLKDERKSAVWCEEMRAAWAVALPLLDSGDEIAARMAFKETYSRNGCWRKPAATTQRLPPPITLPSGTRRRPPRR